MNSQTDAGKGLIPAKLFKKLDELEAKYTLKELQQKAREKGLSPSGTKREIVIRLFGKHARDWRPPAGPTSVPMASPLDELKRKLLSATKERAGRCYELAWRHIAYQDEGTMVHGRVWSEVLGRMIDHAWVITETGYVYEPVSDLYFEKDGMYPKYKMQEISTYTPTEARKMAMRMKHFGPWTDDDRRKVLGGGPGAVPMAAFDRDTTIAQKIVDSGLSGLQLTDALYGAYDQLPHHQRQAFLNTRVTATVWHGTRRRESIEELKRNGFCSYTQEQAIRWLDEAHRRLSAKIKPGPRVTKSLEKWKAMVRGHVKEPWRGYLCVTAIEDAACGEQAHNPFTGRPDSGNLMSGWADRNPEFVYDYLMLRATPQELDRILTEMFGRPIKVKLRVSVEVRTLLNPQDMHLKQRCFSPAEIIDITPCPPKTARQLKTEVDVLWAPQVERKTHFAAGAKYAPRGRQAHDQGG